MQSLKINLPFALLCLALVVVNVFQLAYAEKADQDKPIILEADKVFGNDTTQVYDLNGDILLVKGSIIVTGEDGQIRIDPQGYEFIDVKGTPEAVATFRQRREDVLMNLCKVEVLMPPMMQKQSCSLLLVMPL